MGENPPIPVNEVPNQLIAALLGSAEAMGHRVSPLVRGLPFRGRPWERVSAGGRTDWELFAALLDRIERAVGVFGLQRLGERLATQSRQALVIRELGVTAREAFELVNGHVFPWLLPQVACRQRFLGRDRVVVELELPRGWRRSEAWFHLGHGAQRALPTLAGAPPAEVDASFDGQRGVYRIRLARPRRRMRRRVGPSAVELYKAMLAGQREEILWTIRVSNAQLGHANELRERARLLGVAWSLSARQAECLRLVGVGRTRAEIGKSLRVSPRVVSSEIERILGRSGIRDAQSLIRRFWEGYRTAEDPAVPGVRGRRRR